jgi:hypothetical protein
MRAWSLVAAIALGCGDDEPVHSIAPSEIDAADDEREVAPVARVATADAWLDLMAQRPSALVLRHGALVIDLGSEAARKHVALGARHQLRLAEEVDGRVAGVVVGQSASLDLPLDGANAPALHPEPGLAIAITLRPMAEKQSMTVLWNERPLAHLALTEGWQRRTLTIPPDIALAGENRVRLHFRRAAPWGDGGEQAAAAIASVELGSHARITGPPIDESKPAFRTSPPAATEAQPQETLRVRGRKAEASAGHLWLAAGTALAYYFVPPTRGKLALDLRGTGAFTVSVSTDEDHAAGHEPTVLFEEPLRPTGRRPEIDLSAWGGRPIRLEMSVRGEQAEAELGSARVLARRSVPVDDRARKPRDIIVLTIEGARADVLAVGAHPSLPAFDELASSSLMFERAYALSPQAVPSHSAWLSSVAPPVHLTVRGTFIADQQTLLAEAFARAGYRRLVVNANPHVVADRGLLQGVDVQGELRGAVEDSSAPRVIATMSELLRARTKDRWFAWANVNDPQAPYEPPREIHRDTQAPPGAPQPHHTELWTHRVRLGRTIPGEAELGYVRRLYRGELQIVDKALGELLEMLRSEDRLDAAIVVVAGVHGEEFFEHGGAGHDRTLYEESLRVPLLIRAPQVLAPGRVTVPVDLLDLAPTLADLTGVPVPDEWQGESLVPVIDDPQPPPRLAIAYLGDGSRAGIVGDQKLVLGPGGHETYFDLGRNPTETLERVDVGGVGLRIVRTALAWQLQYEARWRRARWGTGANLRPAFAQDLGM